MDKVAQINAYHMKQFADWLEKLKSIKEGDGTLLDNSMIVYGAGLSDGNRHTHDDLPTLIAGRGGGLHQARPPHRLPQGNADVQSVPDDDGPHGRARWSTSATRRAAGRPGSELGRQSKRMQFPGQASRRSALCSIRDMAQHRRRAGAGAALRPGRQERSARRICQCQPSSLQSAALAEAIGRFYAGAVSGAFGAVGRNLCRWAAPWMENPRTIRRC